MSPLHPFLVTNVKKAIAIPAESQKTEIKELNHYAQFIKTESGEICSTNNADDEGSSASSNATSATFLILKNSSLT